MGQGSFGIAFKSDLRLGFMSYFPGEAHFIFKFSFENATVTGLDETLL